VDFLHPSSLPCQFLSSHFTFLPMQYPFQF
jgi:hypothetical protein